MSVVRIPPSLRADADGKKVIEVEGGTVGELLESLTASFPSLRSRLLDEDGNLVRFVNLYLDGVDVKALDGLDTSAGTGTTLLILPAMAGGT